MISLYYFGEYGVSFFLRFVLRKILKYCTKSRGSNLVYTDSCGLCKNTLYYTHIYTGGKSMAEEIRFVSGQMPSLLYATKQIVAASAITRAIHRHERFTEMLYVYQGPDSTSQAATAIRSARVISYYIIKAICMKSPRPCNTRSVRSALAFPVCSCADCRKGISPGRKRICASGDGRD